MCLRIPVPVWRALRQLAEGEALARGGRASVAKIITLLVEEATARTTRRRASLDAGGPAGA